MPAQPQRGQVRQPGTETGSPQQHVGSARRRGRRDVSGVPPHAAGHDAGEHRQRHEDAPIHPALVLLGERQPSDSHHALRRKPRPGPLVHPGDDGAAPLRVERAGAELGGPAGDPRRGGDLGDLQEQLDRRRTATDHDHVPTEEVGRGAEVVGVQLLTAERLAARVAGPERPLPGPGRTDHRPGEPLPAVGLHREQPAGAADVADREHPHRPGHRQPERPLVVREVAADRDRGALVAVERRQRHPRQLVHAMGLPHPERVPPVLPRAARAGGVVEHHETAAGRRVARRPRREPGPAQVVGSRQPGLTRPDHHHVDARTAGPDHPATVPRRCRFANRQVPAAGVVGWLP